ncbi:MAG: GNAT family N-acetyltransferase [Anaerolineales bacterium]|nr:MAG: GNAT family N-acetyltransferase [Anaerolineales bacterium]
MINTHLQVRRAVAQDHQQIANLIYYEANSHRHLDWRSALDWIGSQNYWVLEEGGRITAALACPEDPPDVAWIRLFAYHPHLSGSEAWFTLWDVAAREIRYGNRQAQVAAIVVKQWFQNILLSHGFELKQNIVLLQSGSENTKLFSPPHGLRIRPMRDDDLPEVTSMDLAAFGRFWHNTVDSLQRAYSQAVCATVAESDLGMVGYQISTGSLLGAHLARLGVRPEAQGRGTGTALVSDLIERLGIHQNGKLSVNTQGDNFASLSLYKKLGFVRTGEHFPVLVHTSRIS